MEEQRDPGERRRRDAIVEPLFGGLEDADAEAEHEKNAPESVAGSRGASFPARLWWLLALVSLLAWWLLG